MGWVITVKCEVNLKGKLNLTELDCYSKALAGANW